MRQYEAGKQVAIGTDGKGCDGDATQIMERYIAAKIACSLSSSLSASAYTHPPHKVGGREKVYNEHYSVGGSTSTLCAASFRCCCANELGTLTISLMSIREALIPLSSIVHRHLFDSCFHIPHSLHWCETEYAFSLIVHQPASSMTVFFSSIIMP